MVLCVASVVTEVSSGKKFPYRIPRRSLEVFLILWFFFTARISVQEPAPTCAGLWVLRYSLPDDLQLDLHPLTTDLQLIPTQCIMCKPAPAKSWGT